jgi:hypothetical protein
MFTKLRSIEWHQKNIPQNLVRLIPLNQDPVILALKSKSNVEKNIGHVLNIISKNSFIRLTQTYSREHPTMTDYICIIVYLLRL